MLTARRAISFISTPPMVATPTPSPPAPPLLSAKTLDFRELRVVAAGGYFYTYQVPPMPASLAKIPPPLVAREVPNPISIYPGAVTIRASTAPPSFPFQNEYIIRPLPTRQADFVPPAGSVFTAIGHIDSLPPNYVRPFTARESERQPHPGSTFTAAGKPVSGSTVPAPPPSLVARDANPPRPHPGGVFFRIGSGDLNPTAPGRLLRAAAAPAPLPHPGSVFVAAQRTDTLLQTPPVLVARQPYVPLYPGWSFTAHAPVDNGDHRLTPLVAQESPRPYPAGSVFTTHGPPDNGLSVPRLVVAQTSDLFFQVTAGTGKVFGITGSPPVPPVPPTPPAQVCEFSADLTDPETFTYDFVC